MSVKAASPGRRIVFICLMLALTLLFVSLGLWQVQRLGEKQALIAVVADRLDDPARPMPPIADWPALGMDGFDYRPFSVEGRFLSGATILVFTSLTEPRGEHRGPGYWVMTPFRLDDSGIVFVNRGFIPQEASKDRAALEPVNPGGGSVTLTGVARRPEEAGVFTPASDPESAIDWIRDPARLAILAGIDGPVAPIYLDLPAGRPGELPQGGETVVEFPNNHLGYALTWFGFAILTPILLAVWLRRRGRPAKP